MNTYQIPSFASFSASEIIDVEARLRKNSCHDEHGYLNKSEEDRLLNWYGKDVATLNSLNITHTQIADRLDSLIARAHEVWRQSESYRGCDIYCCEKAGAILDQKFSVIASPAHLCIRRCPFPVKPAELAHICFQRTRQRYTIINLETDEKIFIDSIFSHLVRKHGFFGGDTELRVSPEKLVNVLELKAGMDYRLKTTTKIFWTVISGSSPSFNDDDLASARKNALAIFKKISEYTLPILGPDDQLNLEKYQEQKRMDDLWEETVQDTFQVFDAIEKKISRR